MLIAKFYVCGGLMRTYSCESVPPSKHDMDQIISIKYDLVRNFGYSPTVTFDDASTINKEDIPAC